MAQFQGTIYQEIHDMCFHVVGLLNSSHLHADRETTILGDMSRVNFNNQDFKGIEQINNFLIEYYKLEIKDMNIKNINITNDGERSFTCILQCNSSSEDYTNMIIMIFYQMVAIR